MNILLWALQIVLAFLCLAGGSYKILHIDQLQGLASIRALPQGAWAFVGALECLGGVGLILPGVIKVLPVLTPAAAAAVAVESVLISAWYIYHGDFSPMYFTAVMAILAGFITYGRFARRPR
jgi:hypothetical protein